MALAISTGQPYREVCRWSDEEIATAWDLIDQAQRKRGKSRHDDGVVYGG